MPKTDSVDLIWGVHPVLELLRSRPGQVREIIIQKSKSGGKIEEIIQLARASQRKIRFEQHITLPAAGGPPPRHQGVIARIASHTLHSLDALLSLLADQAAPPLLLALDSIQDPHNLGAIVRSASAAGVSGIILPKDRSAPLAGTAAKVAAGALAHMHICQVTNLAAAMKRLKKEGFWIYGAAGEANRTIYQTDFSGPICLVIGGEEKGIRPLIREQCDFLVAVPMHSPLDSLNASVAAAVILFEIVRQQQSADTKSDSP